MSLQRGTSINYHEDIKNLHKLDYSAYRISKELGLSRTTVLRIAKKLKLSFSHKSALSKNPIRMKDQKGLIIDLHNQGLSGSEIARQLGYAPSRITIYLNELGFDISHKLHDVDLDFFKTIDNEVKSYVLGFWYADGNVRDDNVRLCITDLDILTRIKNEMKYSGEFYIIKPRQVQHKPQYCMTIYRKSMVDDLTKLGCPPKKSLILNFPSNDIIPDDLVRHFIRGYMDGDGCIHLAKKNQIECTMLGTENFLNGIRKIIKEKLDINGVFYKRRNIFVFKISGNLQTPRFLDWLYEDSTIHLDRKYLIYSNFKKTRSVNSELV